MRRYFTIAMVLLWHLTAYADEAALDVGGRKQLFIDQRFIAHSDNVELRANPAQKLGLLLDAQGKRIPGIHVSRVFEDQGKMRLYLGADSIAIYESTDGLHFTPTGATISGGTFTTIFLDTHETDPSRRYKLFWLKYADPFDPATHGVYAGYSGDGVNFTTAGRVLPLYTDNPALVFWDERISKYVIFTRALALGSENQRRIVRIETDDPLKPWPCNPPAADTRFLTPDYAPVVLQADAEDDPFSDIYYNAATIYPWAQDVYLMFTAQFRHFAPNRQPFIRPRVAGQWEDYGLLEVQMAVSRDGIRWQRPSREPYFPTGLADEWDRWYAVMGPGMVRSGNYLYQYYTSSGRTHDSVILRPEYDNAVAEPGGIGVVRQRLDGFVSADADQQGGWIETPPLVFKGKRLRLNIDTGAMGTAFVELRDLEGKPIPGYTLADCEEVGGNFIDQTVYWRANPDVSSLEGRPVRLYFRLTRAKLYAFQFTKE